MRKAVYTFIFGDYDELKAPGITTPGWDYICFTDDATLRSDIWDVRLSHRTAEDQHLDNKRFSAKHATLFHQYVSDYDLSISLGGQVKLECDADELITKYFPLQDDMMICWWGHDCLYDEAEGCRRRLTDDPDRIDAHMRRYRAEGYPPRNGLYMSGVMARRHDRATVRSMCELWWQEYLSGSRRDQLSLSYAIWKTPGLKIARLDYAEHFFQERTFSVHPHKRNIGFDSEQIKFALNCEGETATPATNSDYIGQVDVASSRTIYGWAADRRRPNTSISVRLCDGDTMIAEVPAELSRPDIATYLQDNGLHGFAIPFPAGLKDGRPHEISVRFESTDQRVHVEVNSRD